MPMLDANSRMKLIKTLGASEFIVPIGFECSGDRTLRIAVPRQCTCDAGYLHRRALDRRGRFEIFMRISVFDVIG